MTREFSGLTAGVVAANLDRVRERIAATGRDPAEVEICAAIKYVAIDQLPVLAEAGITLVGENRAQRLAEAQDAHGTSSTGTSSARCRAARCAMWPPGRD